MSKRVSILGSAVLLLVLIEASCSTATGVNSGNDGPSRITARPQAVTASLAPGYYPLNVDPAHDAVLFVPTTAASASIPLIVMLHGAGGTVGAVQQVYDLGEKYGIAVLAPKSLGATWDLASGAGFAQDVVSINKALQSTFQKINVDAAHIALVGFSDGASYALSLGLPNGDLFTHVIAFSPGFMAAPARKGKPSFFLAHGKDDSVLPIENTQSNIVPYLRGLGYTVRFDSFEGGHHIDANEGDLAMKWFTGRS
jgi:phospholipase/carboxylesterase